MSDNIWTLTNRADWKVSRLADRHYSRQKIGARQFSPPGQPIVLYIPNPFDEDIAWAGWVWWRPFPGKAHRFDGFDGWYCCSLFRNESPIQSSELIRHSIPWVNAAWGLPEFGYDTYVWGEKVRSTNPGYCYQVVGWEKAGYSKDKKKRRLIRPIEKCSESELWTPAIERAN